MQRFMQWIDRANEQIGRAMGWLMAALVALVTFDVISRYIFSTGWVVVQETEWWMYSIIFLMGAGYTFLYDGHVRVDIVYSRLNRKWQRIVDIIGAFIFLFPMCLLLILSSRTFIFNSIRVNEGSPDPGGLPAYYLLKAVIPLGFLFLALQGISQIYKIVRSMQEDDPAQPEERRS